MDNSILIDELKALREYVELNGYDNTTRVKLPAGPQWPNEFMCHACEVNEWEIAQKFIQCKVDNHPMNYRGCAALRNIIGYDSEDNQFSDDKYQELRLAWLDELIAELERSLT